LVLHPVHRDPARRQGRWLKCKSKDEAKRHQSFVRGDCPKVFAGPMVLFEDNRADYGEQRMIGVGLLDYLVVLIVHVENAETIRIISMRKADSNETDLYYQNVGYF
jgi:uncharacterized DUF497 family protein